MIADTQLIEGFLRIDRAEALASHQLKILVPDHLGIQIREDEHQARYRRAIAAGHIHEEEIRDAQELETFLRLGRASRLSACEQAALALALHRHCKLAIDHNGALAKALNEAGIDPHGLVICHPREVILDLIRANSLSQEAAHCMKETSVASDERGKVAGRLSPF